MIFALDTNIISYLLKGNSNVIANFEFEIVKNANTFVIPPLVAYEIRRWLYDNPTPNLLKFTREFDSLYQNVRDSAVMAAESWEKAVDIYLALKRNGMLIDEADIFIAAYCIVNNFVLVTHNTRHFSRLSDLKYVDWC